MKRFSELMQGRRKFIVCALIALLVLVGYVLVSGGFFAGSNASEAPQRTQVLTLGLDLPLDTLNMIAGAFPGEAAVGVVITLAGDPVASISEIDTESGPIPMLYLPSEETLESTYLGDVVQREGIETAHAAIVLNLLDERTEKNKYPRVNYWDVSTIDRLTTSLISGVSRFEDELLAQKMESVMWMLTTVKAIDVAEYAVGELGQALERSQENEIAIAKIMAAEAKDSRSDVIAAVAIVEGGHTVQQGIRSGSFAFFFSLVLVGAILLFLAPRRSRSTVRG